MLEGMGLRIPEKTTDIKSAITGQGKGAAQLLYQKSITQCNKWEKQEAGGQFLVGAVLEHEFHILNCINILLILQLEKIKKQQELLDELEALEL